MERLDEECYLFPNPKSATNSDSNPPTLPLRNQSLRKFLSTGGLDVFSSIRNEEAIITPVSSVSSFSSITYSN